MSAYNSDAVNAKNELSSLIASSESKIDTAIEKFLTSFRENNA